MIMKQLFRHTTSLLRTALLFGVVILVNTQAKAQPVSITADMPDAFETIDPSTIVGDGKYYYIQFYEEVSYFPWLFTPFLGESGNEGATIHAMDYLPFAPNRQWTLEDAGGGKFRLKSKRGIYIYLDNDDYFKRTSNSATASLFEYSRRGSFRAGYYELRVSDGKNLSRKQGNTTNSEWGDISANGNANAHNLLRFARLKPNAAHIIYYRGEHSDGYDNMQYRANETTTRHYLTYSSGAAVSSQRSIIPSNKSLWTLPTAAAYHQDGLWQLEEASDGEFYIKKYNTEQYLNCQPLNTTVSGYSVLGTKNDEYGKYVLDDVSVNRYTRIKNKKTFVTSSFTSFPNGELHLNEVVAGNGGLVAGTGAVSSSIYVDLSSYSKMVIEGTPGVSLRVLLNRQTDATPYDGVEKTVTIGDDGNVEVDFGDLSYVNLNAIKTGWGSPECTITGITLVNEGSGSTRYLSYSSGDGGRVEQVESSVTDWYAAFLPVEVPVPNKDEFFQVRLGLHNNETKTQITLNNGRAEGVTYSLLPGSTNDNMIGATFTPNGDWKNVFKYTNFATNGHKKLVVRFASPVAGNWGINGIVYENGEWKQGWVNIPEGSTYYEMNLNLDGVTTINDFTVFSTTGTHERISIAEAYFLDGDMVNHSGGASVISDANPDLWQLEQIDDYGHFRVKNEATGTYLKPQGQGVTEPNDPTGADVFSNQKLFGDFATPKWFYVNPAKKEIPVDHYVTHRESYLKQYSIAHSDLDLAAQGLATKAQSDWWNFGENANDPTKDTQKVNHFEITHYLKEGNSMVVEFPTVLNNRNDHIYFQRFYNYDEKDREMNLDNLKAHVSLDTRDDGNVQYFLYKNGMVTGQKLTWKDSQGDDIPDGGMARYALRRFNFTNSDGKRFTVAADVSRYSDLTYDYPNTPLNGDLEEPSLTMRYIYYMRDAKEMAASLTACPEGGSKWLETKEFHFPAKRIAYELDKAVGYQGEFIGVRHIFSDYWVFDEDDDVDEYNNAIRNGTDVTYLNSHLVSAVNDNTEGKIEVEIVDNDHGGTGIRLGGWNPTIAAAHGGNLKFVANTTDDWGAAEADFRGFYFYDKMSDGNKTDYGNSRFVVFRYPEGGEVTEPTYSYEDNGTTIVKSKKAYINVYLNNNGKKYQLAQYTIIFDPGTRTIPWKFRDPSITNPTDDTPLFVKGSGRDPKKLVEKAGKPIAKITFDYPANDTYHFPAGVQTRQSMWYEPTGGTLADCSPIPLTFDNTNYSFMGFECNWGSYSIVNKMTTNYGNHQNAAPANDVAHGYGPTDEEIAANPSLKSLQPDAGLQNGFLYIDASEQPGDICSAPFIGDFCSGDKLMFSGWISGSNKMGGGDNRCPGGVTLTVKGEHNLHDSEGRIIYDENGNPKKETVTLYRFCPGQCYELDDGPKNPDGSGNQPDANQENCDNGQYHVIWQQFYFEFTVTDKYDRHWIEVNNNCVSSQGGDFMLDNIEVYAIVPEVIPGINTPLCVKKDGTTEMRLLKLNLNFNKLKSSSGLNTGTAQEGFVFLDKYEFLKTFRTELAKLTAEQKTNLHLSAFDFTTISLDELADAIEDGEFSAITGDNSAYQTAFDAAILGKKTTWYSNNPTVNMNSSIMYFEWNSDFNEMPEYSFASAVNKKHAVYREIDKDGEKWIVMNGNFPELNWKTNTDYYVINSNVPITDHNGGQQFSIFNICSQCSKASVFRIEPPYTVLGLEKSEGTDDYVVCEGQIPTVALNLKGYDLNGSPVDMKDLNFDWWLGDNTANTAAEKLATLENYHNQHKVITYEVAGVSKTKDVKLDVSLAALRSYYPSITSLDGVIEHLDQTPNLELPQVLYLQDVVKAGQLVLHQSSISVPAEKNSDDDPYFYLVACPIHDAAFNQALNPQENQYVAYFCDEPQGLRIKVGQKAPTLKCGFVPNENGISAYNYNFPAGTDPVLSIRLAKKAQFEEVQHGKVSDNPAETYNTTADSNKHFLWLPIRNAVVESTEATGVVRKSRATVEGSDDYNVYLSSTDDPTWDKKISAAMSGNNPSLPIVGKIVKLNAIDTSKNSEKTEKDENRLCIYFIKYLTDAQDEDKVFEVREGYNYTLSLPFKENAGNNSCDGNILINMKIVPDYEVWTGAAGNTDWNNDQNWRRADGSTASGGLDDLYVGAAKTGSPLKDYKTNSWNYRTPKDRIFRKGFAPLYCTHVLMSRDEWGNAPELYDALDGKNSLTASPFPNLRDEDGWDGSTGDNKKKATATSILKFDMQARLYDIWSDTYGSAADKGRSGDMLAEMYQVNSCDEIAFQPGTELLNAHLLNYNSAWVEFELDTKRWYLLGSPLQGTISGEWYAPTGTAQQKTTYYDNVTFGSGYDRYSPAIYQRSWDKAKAVLYEVGADYATGDDAQNNNDDNASQGSWGTTWQAPTGGADAYLDRLGYKPFGAKMANVAIKGIWSNTYNDAQVDYGTGGFSVMVMNHLKGNDADVKAVIRLPKEDTMYDYYSFDEDGSDNGGTDTYLIDHNNEQGVQNAKGRALNRGRLKTDLLLPVSNTSLPLYQRIQREETSPSRYGDMRTYTRVPTQVGANALPMTLRSLAEDVAVGASNLGYYLVENPFPCGLDMKAFFAENSGLQKKYWLLTTAEAGQSPRQQLVQQAPNGEWVTASEGTFAAANGIVAPGQGFFVEIVRNQQAPTTITYTKAMQKQSRYGVKSDNGTTYNIEVGRSQVTEDVLVDADGDGTPETTVQKIVYEEDGVTPKTTPIMQDVVVYNYVQASGDGKRFPLKTRGEGAEAILPGLVITAERDNSQSSALVMQRSGASNDFLPEEDTEVFINSDLVNAPTVYTLCGRLATTINSIHDFRSLPIGVESTSDAPCTLTFRGVEMLGDSISFYDAVEQKLTPLESGMSFKVSGQTQNRYYLVRSLNLKDAAEETHLQIFTEGLKAKVIASTAEPITVVRCFDTGGRLIYTASPQLPEYSFDMPRAGVYIIEAETEHDRKTRKVIVK